MRRIGLFLGVFSVGLVLFMALTGQLNRFIQDERDPFSSTAWDSGDPRKNDVEIHVPDMKNGRDRFTIRGVIDSNEPLQINDTQIRKRAMLRDTVLEMPLYDIAGKPGDSAPSMFKLEAAKVVYEPEASKVMMDSGIVGTSDNGARFETESVEVSWDDNPTDSRFTLVGSDPIRLLYPAIEMYGETGFTGSIDHAIGLGSVTIKAPVVVALRRDAGSGFLGLESTPAPNTSKTDPGGTTAERIFVISDGPLVITRDPKSRSATATFTGGVSVFNAPHSTALHPRPAIPAEHFRCEDLVLNLGSDMGLASATATGVKEAVTATFLVGQTNETYTLRGQTLTWVSRGDAMLTGPEGVSVEGPIGRLSARSARINPAERRCYLETSIEALIHAARLPGASPDADRRSRSWWKLSADRAVVEFASKTKGDEPNPQGNFKLIRATSTEAGGVAVVEQAKGGSRLTGTTLEYSSANQTLEIRGDTQRPTFNEGESSLASNIMRLKVADESLEFIGEVSGRLYGLDSPQLQTALPKAQANDYAEVDCDELEMTWRSVERDARTTLEDQPSGQRRRLDRVVAKSGSSPLSFDLYADQQQLTLRGDDLVWTADSSTIRVDGKGRQVLLVRDVDGALGLQMDAKELEFNIATSVAKATGLVEGRTRRSFVVGKSGGAEDRWVSWKCHEVEAEVSRPEDSDSEKAADPKGKRATIKLARASALPDEFVEIDDGIISARGQSLTWNPVEGTLEVEGKGRQSLSYGEELRTHTLTATKIRLEQVGDDSSAVRAILDGEVFGQLEQRYAIDPNSGEARQSLIWDIKTEHLDALLTVVETTSTEDSTKSQRQLELDTLVAAGGVQISSATLNDQGPLSFSGSRCTWDRRTQRLRVHSEEESLQSLRLGPPDRRDEIVAREIVIGRQGDEVWVFFQDVLRATFFVDEKTRAGRDDVPESFRMLCDNLLVNLVGLGAKVDNPDVTIREAISWGGVNFTGGDHQVVAERAVFKAANQSVTFHGRPGKPPSILNSGAGSQDLGDPIVVRKRRNGFQIDIQGSGSALDLDEIQGVLRLLDKKERTPRK